MNALALIAELTHRCPLRCVYCSNPLALDPRRRELSTDVWLDVFRQAADLGVLQADLTGGEPLARPDLTDLLRGAREAKLYVSLITSGLGLTDARLDALVSAGLDHVQLSFQDAQEAAADDVAGVRAHRHKLAVAGWLRERRVAFTMNVVVHRRNLDRLPEIIALAERLAPSRLEIAHTQYYGWALGNRAALLPTREQVDRSLEIVHSAAERLKGRLRIELVVPDYYARYPKPCMGGWGRKMILVTPTGAVMPCHAAGVIPGLTFENVTRSPLRAIWESSSAFEAFRGEDFLAEPCRSCERRALDFGGCRCQAFLLAGDARMTDPTCSLAPARGVVEEALARLDGSAAWTYRENPA